MIRPSKRHVRCACGRYMHYTSTVCHVCDLKRRTKAVPKKKRHTLHDCPRCGAKMHRGAKLCRACFVVDRQKPHWDTPSEQEKAAEEARIKAAWERLKRKPERHREVIGLLKEKGCW